MAQAIITDWPIRKPLGRHNIYPWASSYRTVSPWLKRPEGPGRFEIVSRPTHVKRLDCGPSADMASADSRLSLGRHGSLLGRCV